MVEVEYYQIKLIINYIRLIMKKSFSIIKLNQEPLVYVKKSTRLNGGKGLFAKENIKKNTPVVIYYGKMTDSEQIYDYYSDDSDNYLKNIFPYVRNTERENIAINCKIYSIQFFYKFLPYLLVWYQDTEANNQQNNEQIILLPF